MTDENKKIVVDATNKNPVHELIDDAKSVYSDLKTAIEAGEKDGIQAALNEIDKTDFVKNNPAIGDLSGIIGETAKLVIEGKQGTLDVKEVVEGIKVIVTESADLVENAKDTFETKAPEIKKEAEDIKEKGEAMIKNAKEGFSKFGDIHSFTDFVNATIGFVNGVKENIGLGKGAIQDIDDIGNIITGDAKDMAQQQQKDPILAAAQGLKGASGGQDISGDPSGAPHTPSDLAQGQDQGGPAVGG